MGRLNLTFQGYNNAIDSMTINGKTCKIIKNKDRTRSVSVDVDKDTAHVVIYKAHGYMGKHWLLWSILYFIVSIFGIFDNKYNKRYVVIDCRFDVSMLDTDTDVKATVLTFRDKEPLLVLDSSTSINVISNTMYYDTDAKKKAKTAKRLKTLLFLAFVAVMIALIWL